MAKLDFVLHKILTVSGTYNTHPFSMYWNLFTGSPHFGIPWYFCTRIYALNYNRCYSCKTTRIATVGRQIALDHLGKEILLHHYPFTTVLKT
jgi:hypothetical protein